MKKETEIVKVKVRASQTVRYVQTLSLNRKDWQEFKRLKESEQGEELSGRLDLREVYDADDIEEFTATVVDDEGKTVQPEDSVEGY